MFPSRPTAALRRRAPDFLLVSAIALIASAVFLVSANIAPAACLLTPMPPTKATSASAHTASATVVTISPLPGTPDATPSTQISFLGAPASTISHIVVRGSCSGFHRGSLKAYATTDANAGASFLPVRAFTVGETVTVQAVLKASGQHTIVGTAFKIGSLDAIPLPTIKPTPAAALAPTLTVAKPATDPTLGDVFLTPQGSANGSSGGAMIVNPFGDLIWFRAPPLGDQIEDLRVQNYLGQKVLTYWQGQIKLGHGFGAGIIDNTHYQKIATVKAGNGLNMDLHEFQLQPDGIAWITIYEPVHYNLSSVGGSVTGIIEDCVIEEIDVRTGLVMFEWHALGHVPLTADYGTASSNPSSIWDWFHVNSIQVTTADTVLINARNTWTVYAINRATGDISWELGGHANSFKLGPNVRFAYQHDAQQLADGTIELFDDEDTPQEAKVSRGVDISLDFKTMTASLVHTYTDPAMPVLTPSEGDIQELANGDRLIGWGTIGLISETSAGGALTLQMHLPGKVGSYRTYRFPWNATPAARPSVKASTASGLTTASASWNGATDVKSWRLLSGPNPSALAATSAPVPDVGFSTVLSTTAPASYVAVAAVAANGKTLATSPAVAVTISR